MNDEYRDNLKKQNTIFKKFKKAMHGITIGITTGLVGLMLPTLASKLLPTAIYESALMVTAIPISAIGLITFGTIKSAYSAIKSRILNNELNDLKEESKELVEGLELEKEKLQVKVDEYAKEKSKVNKKELSQSVQFDNNFEYNDDLENQNGRSK